MRQSRSPLHSEACPPLLLPPQECWERGGRAGDLVEGVPEPVRGRVGGGGGGSEGDVDGPRERRDVDELGGLDGVAGVGQRIGQDQPPLRVRVVDLDP